MDTWNGIPKNPELEGVHAIAVGTAVWLSLWNPSDHTWDFGCSGTIIGATEFGAHCATEGYQYLGPQKEALY